MRALRSFALMGILNATPDSFSDGGRYLEPQAALIQARAMVELGADVIDLGGASTRPGAAPVGAGEELARVRPVLEAIAQERLAGPGGSGVRLSIDTSKRAVAELALDHGASIVNDVTALRGDPALGELIAERGVDCCLMHMLGEPRTMQAAPRYQDVVGEVRGFLEERLAWATSIGIDEQRIMLDPGIGFGKTLAHNLELLRRLDEIVAIGRPVVIGTSRKGFLGVLAARARAVAEPPPAGDRLAGTISTCVLALERGARVFRVHDVGPVRDALVTAAATLGEPWPARRMSPSA